jgi:hypothetical protein
MLRRCRPLALERVVVTGGVVAATVTGEVVAATVTGAARVQGVQGRGYLQQKQSIWRKHHIRETVDSQVTWKQHAYAISQMECAPASVM